MKLRVESWWNKLRMCRHVVSAGCAGWEPVPRNRPAAGSQRRPRVCVRRRVTDIGKCRSKNEDEYFLSADGRLWIVADGLGGQAAGEVASALTIQAIVASMDSVSRSAPADAGIGMGDRLMRAFAIAQNWVLVRSLQDNGCLGMGSTAIAGFLEGDTLHICHVGRVRCYHWSEGQFRCITNDHS
jgi:serine/threonine protein phosphatase PrpC